MIVSRIDRDGRRQLVRRFGYRLNAPRGGKSRKLSRSYRPRLETLEDRTLMTGGILDSAFGIVFSFRWTGAALASGIMGFPLMVRAIRLSIEAVDARLEEAAGTLGAAYAPFAPSGGGELRRALKLDLPLDRLGDRPRHHRRHDFVLRQGHR